VLEEHVCRRLGDEAAVEACDVAHEVFNPNYWKTTPAQTSREGFRWLERTYALRA